MAADLTPEQLHELEGLLRARSVELEGQIERISDEGKPVQLDQQSVGRLSRMDAMQQQQMAQASQSHMRAHLNRVRLALKAIEEDDYGYCKSCDEAIGFDRLQVRPDSPLCIRCQEQNEN